MHVSFTFEMSPIHIHIKNATKYKDEHMQRYELGAPINSGSFATVYRAIHTSTKTPVAIKTLPKKRGDIQSSRYKHSIRAEIEVMTLLKGHKNIVQLLDVIEDDDSYYLVLELCCGDRLSTCNPHKHPILTMTDVINAITHCHQNDIIYADLKSENLIYSRRHGCYKLTDFGSAIKVNPSTKEGVLTMTTPSIAPPRDFSPNCSIVTFKYDVYGVGLLAKALFQEPDSQIEIFRERCLDPNPETRASTEEMQLIWHEIISSP